MVTTRTSAAETRRSSTTSTFVTLLASLRRLGRSMTGSSPAMPGRDHTIRRGDAPRLRDAPRAGVVELVDTPALGAGGASRGGSSPSARIDRAAALSALAAAGRPAPRTGH